MSAYDTRESDERACSAITSGSASRPCMMCSTIKVAARVRFAGGYPSRISRWNRFERSR
ncbi:hypothetical protein [Mycolicibacterium sp. P1-5]|uniref:hypothetical protein n=1 Tax=Mycolicibacterium sp. P1-5 TaxID=2024617 RepID=UPI001D146D49|nr:hypothetical protein [Mycolicibacterium sp. P1-5]